MEIDSFAIAMLICMYVYLYIHTESAHTLANYIVGHNVYFNDILGHIVAAVAAELAPFQKSNVHDFNNLLSFIGYIIEGSSSGYLHRCIREQQQCH